MRKYKERGKKKTTGKKPQIFSANIQPQKIQSAFLPAEVHNCNSLHSSLIKMDMSWMDTTARILLMNSGIQNSAPNSSGLIRGIYNSFSTPLLIDIIISSLTNLSSTRIVCLPTLKEEWIYPWYKAAQGKKCILKRVISSRGTQFNEFKNLLKKQMFLLCQPYCGSLSEILLPLDKVRLKTKKLPVSWREETQERLIRTSQLKQ